MQPPTLYFRPADPAFAAAYFAMIERNRAHIAPYFPKTLKATEDEASVITYFKQIQSESAQRSFFSFIIFEKETDAVLGNIFIKSIDWRVPMCEMAYFIDAAHTGRGIATKAMEVMISYCFDQFKMEKIFLRIVPENTASMRLAEKLGFQLEGRLRSAYRVSPTELKDINYMGLLREEWTARN